MPCPTSGFATLRPEVDGLSHLPSFCSASISVSPRNLHLLNASSPLSQHFPSLYEKKFYLISHPTVLLIHLNPNIQTSALSVLRTDSLSQRLTELDQHRFPISCQTSWPLYSIPPCQMAISFHTIKQSKPRTGRMTMKLSLSFAKTN